VKHENHTNVAEAVGAAYGGVMNRAMRVTPETETAELETDLAVYPPLHGTVEIEGEVEEPKLADVASAVSKQLNTFVVMAAMGDDAETGTVVIYENGEQRFRLRRWYRITSFREDGIKEFMECEGEEWARQHGYVPGPTNVLTADTEAVPFEDVNQLTLKLGMDVSDRPDEIHGILIVKPASASPSAPAAPRQKR